MIQSSIGRFIDPSIIASHFHLREGDVVADFGSGSGHYLRPLSQAVGPSGRVYACEIQKNLVERLGVVIHDQRLGNVSPVWCDIEAHHGTKFADGILDAALLSNVMFQFEDKESALREVARSMHKGSRLFVIDWTDSFGGLGPRPEEVVSEVSARALLQKTGFVCDHTFPAGDHHYGIFCYRQ